MKHFFRHRERRRASEDPNGVIGTDGSPITLEKIGKLRNRVIEEPFEQRTAANQLTGEWIIYLRHNATHYYLCCGAHKDGDQFIYDRILRHCRRDFPDLEKWMKEAANSMEDKGTSTDLG
jgi:hypothetical protein